METIHGPGALGTGTRLLVTLAACWPALASTRAWLGFAGVELWLVQRERARAARERLPAAVALAESLAHLTPGDREELVALAGTLAAQGRELAVLASLARLPDAPLPLPAQARRVLDETVPMRPVARPGSRGACGPPMEHVTTSALLGVRLGDVRAGGVERAQELSERWFVDFEAQRRERLRRAREYQAPRTGSRRTEGGADHAAR